MKKRKLDWTKHAVTALRSLPRSGGLRCAFLPTTAEAGHIRLSKVRVQYEQQLLIVSTDVSPRAS